MQEEEAETLAVTAFPRVLYSDSSLTWALWRRGLWHGLQPVFGSMMVLAQFRIFHMTPVTLMM